MVDEFLELYKGHISYTELNQLSLREIKALRDKRYSRYKEENDKNDTDRNRKEAAARDKRAAMEKQSIQKRIMGDSYVPPPS